MNSAGSYGIERTSSEESEVNPGFQRTNLAEVSSDEEDECNNSLDAKTVMVSSNPFFKQQMHHGRKKNNAMTKLVSSLSQKVNSTVGLLKRLQIAETNDSEENTDVDVDETLKLILSMKEEVLTHVPPRSRERVLPKSKVEPLHQIAALFGRCFNLSLNLKILSDGVTLDPLLATRVMSDLCVLEESLTWRKSNKNNVSDVGSLMKDLRLSAPPKIGGRLKLKLF